MKNSIMENLGMYNGITSWIYNVKCHNLSTVEQNSIPNSLFTGSGEFVTYLKIRISAHTIFYFLWLWLCIDSERKLVVTFFDIKEIEMWNKKKHNFHEKKQQKKIWEKNLESE